MSWFGHVTVVKAVKFKESDILMTVQTQHTYEISCFLISSIKFHFTISRNDKEWRSICSDKINRGKFINGWCKFLDSIFLSLGKMGNSII